MDRTVLFSEAQKFQKNGLYDDALNIYFQILNKYNDINVLHNVGIIYFIKKDYFKAEKYLWYSIKDGLHESYFVENFIKILLATSQYKYALHLIKNHVFFKNISKETETEIINKINNISSQNKVKNNSCEADIYLIDLIKNNKFKEALDIISSKIQKKETKYILIQGAIYLKMRSPAEALKCYKLCLDIEPDNIEANLNYASANIILGNFELSEKLFKKVLLLDKTNIDAYRNLIIIKSMTGNYEEGIMLGQKATQENVNDDQLLSDLATNYSKLNDVIEANRLFDKSMALNINNYTTMCNYGGHLEKNGKRREAKILLEKSLSIKAMPSTLNNLGMIYMSTCNIKKSIEYFDKALILEESFQLAKSNKLFVINYYYSIPLELYEQYIIANKNNNNNQIITANAFIKKSKNKKINLGFISGDFNSHPVADFIIEIIKKINKNNFNVILLSTNSLIDDTTHIFKSICTKWVDVFSLNDLDASKKIIDCNIDLLIDLSGHSSNNRLGIFKYKPAYKTATWLGFNYTTGLASIDYFLTDKHQVPEESQKYYSEKIKYISDHAFCFKPNSKFTEISILPFYNNHYITFGCASRSVRINDDVILVWSKILKHNESYRLQINSISFADEYVCEIYRSKFEEMGITSRQVSFGYYNYDKFLNEIDIMLDCFPHNSGTTLYESIFKGVPFITLENKISLGRLGSAILRELELNDLIADTFEDYINIACHLATSINRLNDLRSNLRNMMQKSNLMNSIKFTKDFENSIIEMIN